MDRMELTDQLYHDYLWEKLDLVFDGDDGEEASNDLFPHVNETVNILTDATLLYHKVYSFHDGFAKVFDSEKGYNFIDKEGKLLSTKWFEDALEFCNGYAAVKNNERWNYIDKDGNYLFKGEGYRYLMVYSFHDGYALVEHLGGGYNYIDKNGKELFEYPLKKAYDFHNGMAKVVMCGDKPASVYDRLPHFNNYNYIDLHGKVISSESFHNAGDFDENGYESVERHDGTENYINKNGEFLCDVWYDFVSSFTNGRAVVRKNNAYNVIDLNGKLVLNEWFWHIDILPTGYMLVRKYDMCNILSPDGKELLDWPKKIYPSTLDNFLFVEYNDGRAIVDYEGNVIFPVGNYDNISENHNFCIAYKKGTAAHFSQARIISCKKVDLGDCQAEKKLFVYQCTLYGDKFKMKYKPIKLYGLRYFLCLDKENVYLYDRFSKSYSFLGTIFDIRYDDNFIVDSKNDQIYFMYGFEMLNITEYYKKKLIQKEKLSISRTVQGVFTKDEFIFANMSKIDKMMDEERKKNVEKWIRQQKEKEIRYLEEKKKAAELEEEERRINELETLRRIEELVKSLQDVSFSGKKKPRMQIDDIFDVVGIHNEIKPFLIAMLRFIDLTFVEFDNAKVEGIDFRGCNIDIGYDIKPQKVYGKSLRNCNFEGIHLIYSADFSGVDIRGCKFGDDDDPMTLDRMPESFKDAIYDETTTYNGEPLTKILEEKKK